VRKSQGARVSFRNCRPRRKELYKGRRSCWEGSGGKHLRKGKAVLSSKPKVGKKKDRIARRGSTALFHYIQTGEAELARRASNTGETVIQNPLKARKLFYFRTQLQAPGEKTRGKGEARTKGSKESQSSQDNMPGEAGACL